jgi:hypothetical protein
LDTLLADWLQAVDSKSYYKISVFKLKTEETERLEMPMPCGARCISLT